MANTCFNELHFIGKPDKVKKANLFLAGLPIDHLDGTHIPGTGGYFQDLYFGQGAHQFGTRWLPDMVTAQALAGRFDVGFVLDYSESMVGLYGQARYEDGVLNDIRLGVEDFAKVKYLARRDFYEYQGGTYRNLETLSRKLLKEKIPMERTTRQKMQYRKM